MHRKQKHKNNEKTSKKQPVKQTSMPTLEVKENGVLRYKPESKPEIEVSEHETKKSRKNFAILFAVVILVCAFTGIYLVNKSSSPYIKETKPIYSIGYTTSADARNTAAGGTEYWKQKTYLETYGGEEVDTSLRFSNLTLDDGLNDSEEDLIFAIGYVDGYTDKISGARKIITSRIPQ